MPPPRRREAREQANNEPNKKQKNKHKKKQNNKQNNTHKKRNPDWLYCATEWSHVGIVRAAIREDPSALFVWRKSFGLPLHGAIRRKDMQIIEELLKHDPAKQVSIDTGINERPLFLEAVAGGNMDVINRIADLVGKAGTSRTSEWDQKNALHIVAENQNVSLLQWLLQNTEIDVDAVSKSGQNALELAGLNTTCIVCLLEHGAIPTSKLLWDAAWAGRLDIARLLVVYSSVDADVAHVDSILCGSRFATTPLFVVAEKGHEEFVKFLLEQGASPNKVSLTGDGESTPLLVAAVRGFVRIAAMLLDSGADIHAKAPHRHTSYSHSKDDVNFVPKESALHLAASSRSVETLRLLLSRGLPVDGDDDCPWTPLHCAVSWRSTTFHTLSRFPCALPEKVQDFKEYLEDRSNDYCHATPLHCATSPSSTEMLRKLDEARLKDYFPWTPLHCITSPSSTEMLRALVEAGADVNARDTKSHASPIVLAAERNDIDTVRFLLANGAKLKGFAVLHKHLSYWERSLEMVELLLSQGANANEIAGDGETDGWEVGRAPLHCAALPGGCQSELVKILIQHGADVNNKCAGDEWDTTALMIAMDTDGDGCCGTCCSTVKTLLEAGANVDVENNGRTPLQIALDDHRLDLAELLLEHGASAEGFGKVERTHYCYGLYSHEREIPYLIDVLQSRPRTPGFSDESTEQTLQRAVRVAELLVQSGIDITATDDYGSTALHWATANGKKSLMTLICRYGGDASLIDSSGTCALHLCTTSYERGEHPLYADVDSNCRQIETFMRNCHQY